MSDEGQDVEISPEERAEINGMFLRLANANYYELLGVSVDADRKAIREAYFTLSQRFHPDVWFGKHIGAWKPRMEAIFREVTKAYDVLSNRNHRAAYDASIGMAVRSGTAANALARAESGDAATDRTDHRAADGEHQCRPCDGARVLRATRRDATHERFVPRAAAVCRVDLESSARGDDGSVSRAAGDAADGYAARSERADHSRPQSPSRPRNRCRRRT